METRNKINPPAGQVISVDVSLLIEHPENPNRMSKQQFVKLVEHLKKSGNYEPIVVRSHPYKTGFFEIINGHHRVKALKQLGHDKVDCVVWKVDDDEVRILLGTLNRLHGTDIFEKKIHLINQLSKKYDAKELIKLLPDSKKQIVKIKELAEGISRPDRISGETPEKISLMNLVFVLTKQQRQVVEEALKKNCKLRNSDSCAKQKSQALYLICQKYLNSQEEMIDGHH